MIQTEQYSIEADRRRSFELLEIDGEKSSIRIGPVMPVVRKPSRVERQEIFEKQERVRAGTNPKKLG